MHSTLPYVIFSELSFEGSRGRGRVASVAWPSAGERYGLPGWHCHHCRSLACHFFQPHGVQALRKWLLCGRWPQEMEHQDNASPAKAAGAMPCAGAERDREREKELPTAAHHSSWAEEFLGQDSSPGYVLAQFFHCCQAGRRTLI